MKLQVIFSIDKVERIDALLSKLRNLEDYCAFEGHTLQAEIVLMGTAVLYFKDLNDSSLFFNLDADIALCNNALRSNGMTPVNRKNIRTVHAGIGELVVKKQTGWVDYVI